MTAMSRDLYGLAAEGRGTSCGLVASAIDTAGQEKVAVLPLFRGWTHEDELQEHCGQEQRLL